MDEGERGLMAGLASVVVGASPAPTDGNNLAAVVVRRLTDAGTRLAAVVLSTSAVEEDPAEQNAHLAAVVVRISGNPGLSRSGWYRVGPTGSVALAMYRRTAGGSWA